MWNSDVRSFAKKHGITVRQARSLQCTAEHLVALRDQGKDAVDNIVAACLYCNRARHRRKRNLTALSFYELVQRRTGRGKWHNAQFAFA